jgi:ABC-type transport system involved in cytochrome bd biosynthesis fused ATPase/permease subunit
MATCKIAFYSAYINLFIYGSIAIYALYKNWSIYGCIVMFLIIAPLISMYLTAYMVTYLWYE